MIYKAAAITHPGIETINEDNFFCNGIYKNNIEGPEFKAEIQADSKDSNVFAVFDGIGGLPGGASAALAACEALCYSWSNNHDVGSAILEADRQVMKAGFQAGHTMGSTCVIVEEKEGRFRSWNIGDSRAYYYKAGELNRLSKDHTEAENARRIQSLTGEVFPIPERYEHLLTQYLGAEKNAYMAEPFISPWIRKEKGSKILLCSDGLYNYLSSKEIISVLEKKTTTLDKCRELITKVLSNRGRDNITVILIEDEDQHLG